MSNLKTKPVKDIEIPQEEEKPGLIQGKKPDSINEWYVALALEKLKFDYKYQFWVSGGFERLGGQVIDFFVYTKPLPTPLEVQGSYWHPDELKEKYKLENIKRALRGQIALPILLYDYETDTREKAYRNVKKALMNR